MRPETTQSDHPTSTEAIRYGQIMVYGLMTFVALLFKFCLGLGLLDGTCSGTGTGGNQVLLICQQQRWAFTPILADVAVGTILVLIHMVVPVHERNQRRLIVAYAIYLLVSFPGAVLILRYVGSVLDPDGVSSVVR